MNLKDYLPNLLLQNYMQQVFIKSKMKISLLSLLLLLIFSFSVRAQPQAIEPAPTMPMSPNASSLAIYADYPVSHYTGIPNISVPLYEIDIDGFKLPISLSYHASGIKVSQEASWVGLGWTLNVGGAISRTVKGRDDFLEYSAPFITSGYYNAPDIQNPNHPDFYDHFNIYTGPGIIVLGNRLKIDSEPDIFYYSLPGAAGKFIIDKTRGPVLMEKSPNVRIEMVQDPNVGNSFSKSLCFRITTPDGTQYYYSKREITRKYINNQGLNQNSTDPFRILDSNMTIEDLQDTYTSSWLLTSITTVNKRVINFLYEQENYTSPTQESVRKYNYLGIRQGDINCPETPPSGAVLSNSSKTQQEAFRLTSVVWDGGYVNFSSSAREDMKDWSTSSTPPKKLDMVQVYAQSGELLKDIKFNYSYFNADAIGQYDYVFKRLKLENVVIDNDQKQRFLFRYIPGTLLAKNSNDTDYWGYHNGKVYGAHYFVGLSTGGQIYVGANKTADPSFMKMATLNEIVYPTGGSTIFDYESNTFWKAAFNTTIPEPSSNNEKIMEVYHQTVTYGAYEGLPATDSYQFTVTKPFKLSIQKLIEHTANPYYDQDFPYAHPAYYIGKLTKLAELGGYNQVLKTFPVPSPTSSMPLEHNYGPLPANAYYSEVFEPGTYTFESLTLPKEVYVRWRINILEQGTDGGAGNNGTSEVVPGGGLRVSKITKGNEVKSYVYPTGTLMVAPVMAYTKTFRCVESYELPVVNASAIVRGAQKTLIQLSNSYLPLSTLRNGNVIGYDYVDEIRSGAGKTRYTFHNNMEDLMHETTVYTDSYFPYAPTIINYYNGLPKKVEYFKGNEIIKETEFNYLPVYSQVIPGFMFNEVENRTLWYGIKFEWLTKFAEVTKTYFAGKEIEEATQWIYNDYFQPSNIRKLVGGIWEEQRIKYATDYSDPVSQGMVAAYQIAFPIEMLGIKGNQIFSGQKTTYQEVHGLFRPKDAFRLKTAQPLSLTGYEYAYQKYKGYDFYNTNGKLLQMTEKGNVTSFVWGYHDYYPVAKLVNATYSQISTTLGSAGLQDLQAISPSDITVNTHVSTLRNQLNQSMVQGYTYKPMVGVTSMSDERGLSTSFVYDSFNRLSEVKDHNGDIVKFYKYGYRGNDTPYGVIETDMPAITEGLAWLNDPYGGIYPGRFRLTFVNTVSSANYIIDIDANTKRFGGFPSGSYNVTLVNLDGLPISGYSFKISDEEDIGGVLNGINIDEGFNILQIFKK